MLFSIGTFLWMIPCVIISILYDIPFRNKTVLNFFVTLLNTILFTFFMTWLDTKIAGITFSAQGLVSYTVLIIIFFIVVQKKGEQLKEADKRQT
jgi:drug/metabolite transporter superfamily protein YnfA